MMIRKALIAVVSAIVASAASLSPLAVIAAPPEPQGDSFTVNQYGSRDQQRPAVARAPDGSFVIAWDSDGQDGSLDGVYARRYDALGIPLGDEFRINVNTRNRQIAPRIAMDASGGFVIAWISNSQQAPGIEIFARRFDAHDVPLGGEFRVDTTDRPTFSQFDVAMAPDGRFAITWITHYNILNTSQQQHALNVQRYSSDGAPLGAVLVVYQTPLIEVRTPTITVDANGEFVVAWFIGPAGIWARRYDATGKARGGSFRVSPVNADLDVDRPQIASDAAGNFTVGWETSGPNDLSETGVYVRSYAASGAALMAAQRVDMHLLRNPELAYSGASLVVTAQSDAIYAQCFTAGAPGAVFRVDDSATLYTPLFASVASDGSGNLVFAWQNPSADGDHSRDVHARLLGSCQP